MKKFSPIIIILIIACTQGPVFAAQSKVPIQLELNIVDLVKEVSDWVKSYLASSEAKEKQRIEENRQALAKQLVIFASLKKSVAKNLRIYADSGLDKYVPSELLYGIPQINRQLRSITKTINDIDPKWVISHPALYANYTDWAHEKKAMLEKFTLVDDIRSLTETDARKIADALELEAQKLVPLAEQLAT